MTLDRLPTQADLDARRLRTCVDAWPDAVSGGYDPRCCRFPKSCSPHGHAEAVAAGNLTDADLEPAPSSTPAWLRDVRVPIPPDALPTDRPPLRDRREPGDPPWTADELLGPGRPPETWALYGFVVPDGRQLAGCWMQVLIGPIRPPGVVPERMSGPAGPPLLATWDHRPGSYELRQVLPPEALEDDEDPDDVDLGDPADAVEADRRALAADACPDDPDGLHHSGCGCPDVDPLNP